MLALKFLYFSTFLAVTWAVYDQEDEYELIDDYYPPEPKKETPKPYHFGYEIKDKHGSQHRHEHSDGDGTVKGSYGFIDERGIHRLVNYIADKFGFRAQIMTNEKGTANEDPADVIMHSHYEPSDDYHSLY